MNQLTIIVLPGEYAICRMEPGSSFPSWAVVSAFYTVSKSDSELSIVCDASLVPPSVECSKEWRLLQIAAVLDLSLTGITAKFSTALADAGVNLCVIATHDTDYILVQQQKLSTAVTALKNAGFAIQQ